ncbi:hypothetical protein F2Q69_00012834 [Brassica cretica]|uniref:Uncharacterized protein n=1 Tax=Brassica cretica TaxID=69181 RepID=A0A8S9QTW2_BRACR|nr:hypothetical protein F2Q69_00012834 [Brassica cretica]
MLRGSVNANLPEVELDSPRHNLSPTPTRVPTLMRLGPIMDNEDDLRGSGTADLLEKELDFPRHNPSPTLPRVLMRLGSIMENEDDPMIPPAKPPVAAAKRRPGRPLGRKNITPSPPRRLGCRLTSQVPPHGRAGGGLALLWKDGIDLEIPLRKKKKGILKYDRSLSKNPEVLKLIEDTWSEEAQLRMKQKVDKCRTVLSSNGPNNNKLNSNLSSRI